MSRGQDRGEPPAGRPQRGAADPTLSVWVGASAGTGKTKVLSDRVLRLMLGGTRPERILCLTFTRAAAAEMAMRINGELAKWTRLDDGALDADLADLTGEAPDDDRRRRARRLFATALDAPGGLKIMTIHAFCQSLLGRFPIEAGVAPHFEVLDERNAAKAIAAAQDAVLRHARTGADAVLAEALDEVTGQTDENTFLELMEKLRGARARLRAMIGAHGSLDNLIAATQRLLGVPDDATAEDVITDACRAGAFDRDALAAACRALAIGSDAERRRSENILRWLNAAPDERAATFNGYYLIFHTQKGTPRKDRDLITQKARAHDPGALEVLLNEQRGLAGVIERRNAALVARATAALLRLGGAMLARYDRHKALRARLDYDDLVLRAAQLLRDEGAAPWVLYKLDGGLDHILVDEAQDTSPEQWRVIAALADEFFSGAGVREDVRTVFVVGDEKQSIFSFQGADLDELERMRAHFAARAGAAQLGFREVGLDLSYRSTGAVLAAVDAVFARDPARDGVAFADHVIEHRPERQGHAGTVELWPLVVEAKAPPRQPWAPTSEPPDGAGASARLARCIADTVRRWLDDGEVLEARGRPVKAGDVMVLVRTRTRFVAELMRALKHDGVPVAGADRMVLSDQLAVMDLVALGEFLLLPDDDLTLATVLKGPLIGLDEDELFALAHDRDDGLWRTLARRRDERPVFARAHAELSGLLARADFVPPYELFADVLGARGGRRNLVARLGVDANDPIDEFLSLALDYERSEPPSLQGFLHWLAAGDVEVKRDLEHGRNEVRVMTVHGAKGLEAPIVFLPDTTSTPRPHGARLLWHEGDDGDETLLWPVRKEYDEARCREARDSARQREMKEYRRLLYVAMTRAEDRLYVCGWQARRQTVADDCWYRLVAAGLDGLAEPFAFDRAAAMRGAWAGTGLRIAGRQTRAPAGDVEVRAAGAVAEALPGFALVAPAPEPAPPRPLAPSRPTAGEPAALSPLAATSEEARFRRGRLIHRLLQLLPEVAPEARDAACRRFLAHPGHGLDGDARDEIAAAVRAVLDDPDFAPLFGPGSRAEVPLVGVVGPRTVSGQIDRLVVGEHEVMIIDYKSNAAAPENEAAVAAAYLDQMAAYRAVLARIYPDKSIRCALLWSEGPRLMRLSDAALSGRAP